MKYLSKTREFIKNNKHSNSVYKNYAYLLETIIDNKYLEPEDKYRLIEDVFRDIKIIDEQQTFINNAVLKFKGNNSPNKRRKI